MFRLPISDEALSWVGICIAHGGRDARAAGDETPAVPTVATFPPGVYTRHPRMAKKSPQPAPRTFEEALAELETILKQIESGSLGLEDSLSRYERGNFLIQHCRGVLNTAEKQIELISGSAEGGVRTTAMPREMDGDDEDDESPSDR